MRGHRAHVTLTLFAAAVGTWSGALPLQAQTASSTYMEPNPNVTVDLSVLDGFSGAPNMADMLRPGYAPTGNASLAPGSGSGSAPSVPAFLVRPDAPRYAPLPADVQALIQNRPAGRAVPAAAPPAQRSLAQRSPAPVAAAAVQPPPSPRPAPAPAQQTAAVAPPTPPPVASLPKAKTAPAPPPPPPALPKAAVATAAPPPPPPAPEKAPAAKPENAALTTAPAAPVTPPAAPSAQSAAGDTVRIAFPAGQSQLPANASAELDKVVGRLAKDASLRVQLMAYADGDNDGANKARRLSLSRALAVRAYLIDNEITSTRMDVRALGNRSDDGPADRVDVVVVNR